MNTRNLMRYNLWDHYFRTIRLWGDFRGRATRSEFWGYCFFCILFYIAWGVLCKWIAGIYTGSLMALYKLVFMIPGVSLLFRRLHDTGRSGWHTLPVWLLIILAVMLQTGFYSPYESGITVLYILSFLAGVASVHLFITLGFFKSVPGRNAYGLNPYPVFMPLFKEPVRTVEI